jgi:hypothetical protein
MNSKNTFISFTFVISATLLVACTPSGTANGGAAASVTEPTMEAQTLPTQAILATATSIPGLVPEGVFQQNSEFCQPELVGSSFTLACDQNTLSITQAEGRRKVDALLMRSQTVNAEQFNLEADVTSLASQDVKSDQNAYGFYFLDADGVYKAVRVQGQYLDFETWDTSSEPQVQTQLSPSFSPAIKYTGQENHLRLACTQAGCELYANETLAGRWQTGISGKVQTIGLFTASAWDELFGQVSFRNLTISDREEAMPSLADYHMQDDLKSNTGTFSATGLSGAFNDYDQTGFHFSPVIPYGYYSAKTGPALQDVDVYATVTMDIVPDRPGSQYAGLVCRSSRDGMYMAVIGVDGTYTIYRDTPQKPFTLLAEHKSDAILSGGSPNALRLVCSGNNIDFYINGQLVESLTDTRYQLNYGRAGIYTKAGGEPSAKTIIFSDLSIEEIEAGE